MKIFAYKNNVFWIYTDKSFIICLAEFFCSVSILIILVLTVFSVVKVTYNILF